VQHGGVLFQLVRDARAEDQATDRVRQLGLAPLNHTHFLPQAHPHFADLMLMDPDPGAWIEFMLSDVPQLRAEGWLIDIADTFPVRLVEPEGGISFEIQERSGIDWFDLDLGVMLDGKRVSLVPALLDYIAGGPGSKTHLAEQPVDGSLPLLLPLPDGRLLAVPLAQLQPILAPLLELFAGAEIDDAAGLLRLSRRNAGDLALIEAVSSQSGIAWTGGDSIRALGRQLREHGGIPPCKLPANFRATLRGYQEQGLAWLQFLRTAGLGGVLADDMGLGKTVQALAHLAVEQAEGRLDRPALLICPTSLVPNWLSEAARFAPSLSTLVLHGPDRSDRFASIVRHDLVITTYPLLARDHAVLTAQDWHVVILDEAQTIKNPLATTSKLARTLRARQRLCLSGTPLENHLGELWSLFDFLLPGFLGDSKQFGWRYRGPIEKGGNAERQMLLAQRITPFLLRRTKEQVAADLPPKTEITETIEMAESQRAIYEGIRLAMHAKVRAAVAKRGIAGSGIIILDALLKLRQACCDPRLLKLAAAKASKARSAKLDRLLEMLPQMLEEGRRVLLFSQFTSMLALIEAELSKLALPYVLLTGDTKDRTTPIRRFQAGEANLFLISLKAGGTGLNLTAADTVIHYDPWWNPAVENQASDRAHRIGQDKPVFVHRLTTAGTIEEKMEVLKQRKHALAAGILNGTAAASLKLTEHDLDLLFT
jgi:superfamily II DNA or RNA helicase